MAAKIRPITHHSHQAAVEAAHRSDRPARMAIAVAGGIGLVALVVLIALIPSSKVSEPGQLISTPTMGNHVAVGTVETKKPVATVRTEDPPSQQRGDAPKTAGSEVRLTPNFSGNGAVSDGRTYSVELIAAGPDIPIGTKIFSQGIVERFDYADIRSRPYAVVQDEQRRGKTLLCAMTPDEGEEVFSLYHLGEVVQVSGDYMGTLSLAGNPSMPILSGCRVADRTTSVVR